MKVAVLTSGGDAPGMNGAIRAVARSAFARGWEVTGVRDGYQGLLEGRFRRLTDRTVGGILHRGGTVLGTARAPRMREAEGQGEGLEALRKAGIEGLVVIGGEGSLKGALALTRLGVPAVGVPATIDNDVPFTDMAIGVDTALNTALAAIDKIKDTASSHRRAHVVEVMGRDCGYLAMTSAIAVGADLALFPEAHKTEEQIIDQIVDTVMAVRKRQQKRARRVLIVKAEGVHVSVDRMKTLVDAKLRAQAPDAEPSAIETRVTVLGHVVRGGRPSALDRLIGSRLANVAVRGLMGGHTHKMAAWMSQVDIPPAAGARSPYDPHVWLVDLAAVLAETENLIAGKSQLSKWRAGAFEEIEDALLL